MKKDKDALKMKLVVVLPHLNERQRRILIAAEVNDFGYGGIQTLSDLTGVSRPTIYRGMRDLNESGKGKALQDRIRREGGGRKKILDKNPEIAKALENLIEPSLRTVLRY